MLTVLNPSLLVQLVNKDVLSASTMPTALQEMNVVLTKLAAAVMMMMTLLMELPFLAS